jgi:hypothetical protein
MGDGNGGWPHATTGTAITVAVPRETNEITCNPAAFTVGDLVVMYIDGVVGDDPIVDIDVGSGEIPLRRRTFRSTITAKGGSSVTLYDPLPFDLPLALNPTIAVVAGGTGFTFKAGLEDLEVDCNPSGVPSDNISGVTFWGSNQCWMRDVRVIQTARFNVNLLGSYRVEIRRCFIDRSQNPGSNNGAGILCERTSLYRFEDNIIYWCFPHVEFNFGCSGGVFAYNMCQRNSSNNNTTQGGSIDSNHGAHNQFNLYEGNCSGQFCADGYYGSVSDDVVFRNRFHGTNDESATLSDRNTESHCVELNKFCRRYSLVENVLGATQAYWTTQGGVTLNYENTDPNGLSAPFIYQLGYPDLGNSYFGVTTAPWTLTGMSAPPWAYFGTFNVAAYGERDLRVSATLLRKGNYNSVDGGVPASEDNSAYTEPDSILYPDGAPSYFNSLNWPAYGTGGSTSFDITTSFQLIPAGYRYFNGGANPP